MTPTTEPRVDAQESVKIRVTKEAVTARTIVSLGYGCPDDPQKCTVAVATLSAVASAALGTTGPSLLTACHVTIVLASALGAPQDIIVNMTGDSNVGIDPANRSRTVHGLTPGGTKSLTLPFNILNALLAGHIDLSIVYNSTPRVTGNIPTMTVTLA